MVLAVDPAARIFTVSHRPVPGLMPAMVMPFQASRGEDLEGLHAGSRVTFELRLSRAGSRAFRIRVAETNVIDGDLRLEAPPEKLSVGAPVPEFTLTDHLGRTTRLSDFAGRVVALNFIYTRCPLPEVCPRLSAAFAALQRRFRERIPAGLVLLSVTLDPLYDSPEVLARYAASAGARGEGWRFLTGEKPQVDAVARRFGLVHWPEEGLIVHTSVTALIGADGRLKALVTGSAFRLEQLADLVAHQLAQPADRQGASTAGASPTRH
jgi:protein SCO1/2